MSKSEELYMFHTELGAIIGYCSDIEADFLHIKNPRFVVFKKPYKRDDEDSSPVERFIVPIGISKEESMSFKSSRIMYLYKIDKNSEIFFNVKKYINDTENSKNLVDVSPTIY